jgi:hypothetical protein
MSETLTTQMHDYFAYLDEEQGAVDLVTVREPRIGDGPVRTIQLTTPSPRRTRRHWVIAGAASAAVLFLVGGWAWLVSPTASDAPVADTVVATTVVESTPTPVPPTTSNQQPQWLGLTEDLPEGVEFGSVATSLGSARWVHLNSDEYLLPSLGQLSRNSYGGYTVDGLEIFVASDSQWEFWKSDDGITWRGEIEATSNAFAFEWLVPYVDGSYVLGWGINTDPLEISISDYGAGGTVDLSGLVPPKSDGFTWTLDVSKPLSRYTDDGGQSLLHIRYSGPDGQVDQRLLVLGYGVGGDYASYLNVPWNVDNDVSLYGTSETLFAFVGDPDSNRVSVWRSSDGYGWTESGGLHEQLGAPVSSSLNVTVLPANLLVPPVDSQVPEYMRNQLVVVTTPGYGWESSDGVNWTRAPDGFPGGADLIRLESGWFATDGDAWWMHLGDSWVSLADLGMEHAGDGCQTVPRGAGQTTVFFSTGTCTPDSSQQSTTDLWIISVDL